MSRNTIVFVICLVIVAGGLGYYFFFFNSNTSAALTSGTEGSANNAELKSLLQTGLKIFQGHEQHAEHVAAGLK